MVEVFKTKDHEKTRANLNTVVDLKDAQKIKQMLTSAQGYEELKKLAKEDPKKLEKIFSSQDFCYAAFEVVKEYENGKRGKEYENFENNISKMLLDNELGKIFFKTYPYTLAQRWAFGILYNSKIGRDILWNHAFQSLMDDLKHLNAFGFASKAYAFIRILKNMSTDYDDKKLIEMDHAVFKSDERLVNLNTEEQKLAEQLNNYLTSGKGEEKMYQALKEHPQAFVHIIESEEGRKIFLKALKNDESRSRLRELLTSDAGVEVVCEAVRDIRGKGTVGLLYSKPEGRKLVAHMLTSPKGIVAAAKLVYAMCKGQSNEAYTQEIFKHYEKMISIKK